MPLMNTIDAAITARLIFLLVRPFKNTPAYKLGIIDAQGNPLKKSKDLKTAQEQSAYTVLDRLVFKLKRLVGDNRLATLGASFWLLKEGFRNPEWAEKMLFDERSLWVWHKMVIGHQGMGTLNVELQELREYNKAHPNFMLTKMILEDGAAAGVAANNVGGGGIAGTSKQSEPGVYPRKKKKFLMGPLARRKLPLQEPVDATAINRETRKA